MPELPKMITVDQEHRKVLLDGVEFPWYIDEGGVSVSLAGQGELPRVTLTVLADALEVLPAYPLPGGDRPRAGVLPASVSTHQPRLMSMTIEEFVEEFNKSWATGLSTPNKEEAPQP